MAQIKLLKASSFVFHIKKVRLRITKSAILNVKCSSGKVWKKVTGIQSDSHWPFCWKLLDTVPLFTPESYDPVFNQGSLVTSVCFALKRMLSTPALSTLLLSSGWCVFREELALSSFLCFLVLILCTFELEWRMTTWPVGKKKNAKKAVVAQYIYILYSESKQYARTLKHSFSSFYFI